MKKQLSVSLIAMGVLIAIFVAGCTSQTASPTPSSSVAESTASTAKMASYVQSLGYNVTKPFNKTGTSATKYGTRDIYGTTAKKDGNQSIYLVSSTVFKSPTESKAMFDDAVSYWKAVYTPVETTSSTVKMVNSTTGIHMVISQDTTNNVVFHIVG
jgi:outer membrane lipoprotein-sorting protein